MRRRNNEKITIVVGVGLHDGAENLYNMMSSDGQPTLGLETSADAETILKTAKDSGVRSVKLVGGQAQECIHDIALLAQELGMNVELVADHILIEDGDLDLISPQRREEKRSFLTNFFNGHKKIKII